MQHQKVFAFKNEYFIFLLPAFFIIHRLSEHYEAISIAAASLLFLNFMVASILVFAVFILLFKNSRKAFLFTAAIMSYHFFYGSLHDALKLFFGTALITQYLFIIPFSITFFILFFLYFKNTKKTYEKLVNYLNLVLVILIVTDGIKYIIAKTKSPIHNLPLSNCTNCPKPDIYFIISDGYAGKQQLIDIFKFDNAAFYNDLKSRGFYLVDSSFSNYKFTANSLTSMLNMQYLKNFKEDKSHEAINKNTTVKYLAKNGYHIKNYSLFKIADQQPFLKTQYFPTGIQIITNHTFLGRLNKDLGHLLITHLNLSFAKNSLKKIQEKEQLENFRMESKITNAILNEAKSKADHPRFIYGHFIMPHGPYLFDRNGKVLNQNLPEKIKYVEYLQYANQHFLGLIDGILQSAAQPPIIIFMSDHGHRTEDEVLPEKYYYSNINAIYLPDKNYNSFYKGMSNINQFRVLFNTYFNQELPLLKDSIAN